jgi:nicotinate dehydrogenase subunit B
VLQKHKLMKSTRREFIKQTGLLTIGFSLIGTGFSSESNGKKLLKNTMLPSRDQIDAWLQVLENGRIRVLTGKMELGQGIRTAIMQVAAEELNTDPGLVEVNLAETNVTPDEGYTAGSRSIETSAMSVRYAAATAREKLLKLASGKLNVPASGVELKNGVIRSGESHFMNY